MNIQLQICSLAIIIMLYIIYKSQRSMGLYQEKLFGIEMHCAIATLSFDALSIVGIHYRNALPLILVHTLCKLYLISIMTSSFAALFYVLVGLVEEKKRLKIFHYTSMILALQSVIIAISPINVFEEGRIVYSEGLAVILTYFFTVAYIIVTLTVALALLYRVNHRRAIAVTIWMSLWVAAAVIQFIRNDWLLVGFAGGLGIIILYIMLESPETYHDKQFGCFNSYSFDIFCADRRNFGKKFSVMSISEALKENNDQYNSSKIESVKEIISNAFKIKGINVFKNIDSSLFLTSENPDLLREFYNNYALKNNSDDYLYIMLSDSDCFTDSFDLMDLFSYCLRSNNEQIKLTEVTPAQVENFREEEHMINEIRSALQEDRVLVYLQPIYSIKSKRFETAEALVRIRGKDGKLISPSLFIPVAEKVGIINDLGERVFEKVCKFISEEDTQKVAVKYIEVNLSVVQCEQSEMANNMKQIMKRYNISPDQVNFEITETGSVKTKIVLLKNMNLLRNEGSTFSLDDFGKGESNLIYLVDMPVSILKMDYDLTKSYYESDKAKQVVCSIVELAHKLGMKVVAEGIETKQELDDYEALGVDYIQGFYFSRPIPMDSYLDFVHLNNTILKS